MPPTKEEIEAENARLHEALADAHAAAADAEQRADDAESRAIVRPNVTPKTAEPSYGLAEGTRAELELNGYAISPFTSDRLIGDGNGKPRVVDQDEYDRVVKLKAAERNRADRAN